MANARHATLSEGGSGKFHNMDGVITDYEFTTVHPFAKEGTRRSQSDFAPLYGVLTAQMDGAKEPDVDVLLVGSADDFYITDRNKTLTPVAEGRSVWAKGQWGKLIASLETLGCETENADFAEGVFNYQPIIGRRVRFQQEQQFDKNGKLKKRMGKGRDGKPREYDDTTTVITADYGMAVTTPTKGAKGVTTMTKVASKANGAAKEVDLTDTADEALVGLLDKFGGSAPKAKLVSAPAQLFLKKTYPAHSDELRKILYDDEYLNDAVTRGVLAEYKQSDKLQTVSLVPF